MEEGGGEKDANERTSDERFCFSSGLGVAKIERNSERECERRKRVIETSRWGGEERRVGNGRVFYFRNLTPTLSHGLFQMTPTRFTTLFLREY